MSASAEVNDLMMELMLHDQGNRTTYKFVTFTDIYRIDLDLLLDFKSESDFTVDSLVRVRFSNSTHRDWSQGDSFAMSRVSIIPLITAYWSSQ